jgi:hypothetical protein
VLKFNDANLDRQKEVEQSHSGRKKSVGKKLPSLKTPVLKKRTSTAPNSTSVANNDTPCVTPTPDSRSNTPIMMEQQKCVKLGKRDSISVPNDTATTTDNGEPSRKRKRSDIEKVLESMHLNLYLVFIYSLFFFIPGTCSRVQARCADRYS